MYPFLKMGTNCCLSSFGASRPETGVRENTYFYFWPESGKGNFVFKNREKEGEREKKTSAPNASMKPGRKILCIHSPAHFPSAWLGIIKETSNSWILPWEGMKWNVHPVFWVFVVLPRDLFLSCLSAERNGTSGCRSFRTEAIKVAWSSTSLQCHRWTLGGTPVLQLSTVS